MAKHDIELELPKQTVMNKDLDVVVRSDGNKKGTLQISRGSIDWKPSPNSKTRYRLTWEQFDTLMKEHGKELGG